MIDKTECVIDDETQWIHQGPDLAAVVDDHEYGWFQILLEDILNKTSRRFTKVSDNFPCACSLNKARQEPLDSFPHLVDTHIFFEQ